MDRFSGPRSLGPHRPIPTGRLIKMTVHQAKQLPHLWLVLHRPSHDLMLFHCDPVLTALNSTWISRVIAVILYRRDYVSIPRGAEESKTECDRF